MFLYVLCNKLYIVLTINCFNKIEIYENMIEHENPFGQTPLTVICLKNLPRRGAVMTHVSHKNTA